MAIILSTSKKTIQYADYNQSNGNYCRFTLYLKLVSWDSTNMTIAVKLTYKHTNSGYYSYLDQHGIVTLNGTSATGPTYSPGYWGTTERDIMANVKGASSDTSGWVNITIPRSNTISFSWTDTRTDGGGTYASGSGTVYFPNDTWVNIDGVWKRGWVMVNINGTWKWATGVYINNNGSWKEAAKDANT